MIYYWSNDYVIVDVPNVVENMALSDTRRCGVSLQYIILRVDIKVWVRYIVVIKFDSSQN